MSFFLIFFRAPVGDCGGRVIPRDTQTQQDGRRQGPFYSSLQELQSGAYLWNTPEGKTVLVTEVKGERTPPGFKDAVYKGEVTKCVKSLKPQTALGI